jgi:hypothetical protein
VPDAALMRWEWEGGAVLLDATPPDAEAAHAESGDCAPRIPRQRKVDVAAAAESKNDGQVVVDGAPTHKEAV